MKIQLEELRKALTKMEKCGSMDTVEVEVEPGMHRILIKFTAPQGDDRCQITIFSSESQKMSEITTTTRL